MKLQKPSLFFGRIAKQNPIYEMVPSVCLRQQFAFALAFKFIAEWLLTIPLSNFTCR